MVTETVDKVQEQVESTFGFVKDNTMKVFHLGLGVVAMAQDRVKHMMDDTNSFATKLVEKGEGAEKDSRKALNEFVEPYQKQVRDQAKQAGDQFNEFSEMVLNRLNIPSASNIEDLNKKVASLSRKVDQLKKAQP